ncbi:DUF3783 domain-containing protein [Terrisporobacter mayombei]|uniref:DUF3783 domain-containing protein n=1 Tax=Terrisporobacter mayombei TaxID=1541 RepID=A0ABY9Q466_9FIRM|nr:DUF3783 domain-containing protein [Terrisporobacter mayombei]MCC3869090.1 DUF3783 domain-containing protein [Terrisporobacter mayombei]WMT82776.1 hypothetical protein TEMA_32680 [Terrisporobacter mayombei]
MSFEKLNQSSISDIHDRSCMIIVNFNKKECSMIKNIGRLVGIKDCIFVDSKNGKTIIKDILNDNIFDDNEEVWTNKAVIFNNITQLKINGFLDSLKKMKITRPLSAVVTDTTIDWTLNKLVYNLIQERQALKSGQTLNH